MPIATQDSRSTAANRKPVVEMMPGHWLLARMGKRVLRPGGLELTRRLLDDLAIDSDDSVVEFAPGLGVTARLALARHPKSYTAIERDRKAAAEVTRSLQGLNQRCVVGAAEETGLADECASVVYGEAMLSMQVQNVKAKIAAEAARLLVPGGRYGIHELCLVPDDLDPQIGDAIARELSGDIHVGVRPFTAAQWRELLTAAGLRVISERHAPMHLLEPRRIIRDEGWLRTMRFVGNLALHGAARGRVLGMRRIFRKYRDHLGAISLVATKS